MATTIQVTYQTWLKTHSTRNFDFKSSTLKWRTGAERSSPPRGDAESWQRFQLINTVCYHRACIYYWISVLSVDGSLLSVFRLRHASVANARSTSTVRKHEHRSKKEKKKVNWWEFCRNISCSWPDDGQCVWEQGWFTKLHPYSHGSGECGN